MRGLPTAISSRLSSGGGEDEDCHLPTTTTMTATTATTKTATLSSSSTGLHTRSLATAKRSFAVGRPPRAPRPTPRPSSPGLARRNGARRELPPPWGERGHTKSEACANQWRRLRAGAAVEGVRCGDWIVLYPSNFTVFRHIFARRHILHVKRVVQLHNVVVTNPPSAGSGMEEAACGQASRARCKSWCRSGRQRPLTPPS